MSKRHFLLAAIVAATPVAAQESRELDAHVHGVSELNMAFAGNQIAVELHAPGFDIVGFEYAAESEEDLAAVEAALATLANPLDLFIFPEAAGCSVLTVEVALLQDDDDHDDHDHDAHDHDAHDHDAHDHDAHDHDEHAEHEDHDEHGHDDHAEHDDHDEHGHDDHGDHDGHDHDDHAEDDAAAHSEYRADYLLSCSDIDAVDTVTMAFFDVFETSQDLEVVIFTTSGGQSFDLNRDTPVLDLSDAL